MLVELALRGAMVAGIKVSEKLAISAGCRVGTAMIGCAGTFGLNSAIEKSQQKKFHKEINKKLDSGELTVNDKDKINKIGEKHRRREITKKIIGTSILTGASVVAGDFTYEAVMSNINKQSACQTATASAISHGSRYSI